MSDTPRTQTLTILLLSGEHTESALDLLSPEKLADPLLEPFDLQEVTGVTCVLFVKKSPPRPPRWAPFFAPPLAETSLGLTNSASAVLVVQVDETWLAITFGHSRHLIRSDLIVRGFGLRTTLNSVSEEALRSIDKETFDSIASHSRHQASRDADAGQFGLDPERDLLRAVTGKPEDESLGPRISGMDALAVTVEVELPGVPHFLSRIRAQYEKSTYAERFPWVENVKRINNAEEIERLDALVFAQIADENFDRTWLAPPEVLTWQDVRYFSYSKSTSSNGFTDIHWRTLLRHTGAPLSRAYLKHKYIYCHGEDGVILRQWPAYSCVYAEISSDNRTFLLSNGDWYEVSRDFVGEIDTWFAAFPRRPDPLPIYDHEGEADYNRFVANTSEGHFALLDRKLIMHGGSKVEFCDLLGLDGEIIHIKRYAGSSGLSHLFMQGFVSGELLRIDKSFRKKLKTKVPETHFYPCSLHKASSRNRRITFGIISRTRGDFVLPFFSKVALRQASRRLEGYGYAVFLTKVDMDEVRARREKPKRQL